MFNAARGRVLVAALFHVQIDGPAWPDAQPWGSVIFTVLAAVIVVALARTSVAPAWRSK